MLYYLLVEVLRRDGKIVAQTFAVKATPKA